MGPRFRGDGGCGTWLGKQHFTGLGSMDGDNGRAEGTAADKPGDYVLPFQLEASGARGRLIRLGPAVDEILTRHAYPEPVLLLLGEAVALTALLGASLKFDGRLILQTQSGGPVSFMVVQYSTPGHLRGYAAFNGDEVAKASNGGAAAKVLLGGGQLAMTIDPGAGMERYQGIVALTGETLADAAHEYFDRSEQIPTFIRIAVARHYTGPDGSAPGKWTWRAGGLMVQKLTAEGGRFGGGEGLASGITGDDDDDGWRRALALAATVEDHELLDPALPSERLLYRLLARARGGHAGALLRRRHRGYGQGQRHCRNLRVLQQELQVRRGSVS